MPQPVRRRIFISYRRSDSAGHAGRLKDDLTRLLGPRLFMDVADIAAGAEFPVVLDTELRSCGVVLAVIGPQWHSVLDARRDGVDFVRLEIGQALTHQGITVVPVLVQGAAVPSAADLPVELKALTDRQAVTIRDDRWKDDVAHLARQLRVVLKLRRWPLWLSAAGAVLLAAIAYLTIGRPPEPTPFDRPRAQAITVAAAQKAGVACSPPKGSAGECPVLLRFQPDGAAHDVYYDTGFCAFKGTPFGDCVLQKLERVRIPPFNDRDAIEVGLDIAVEANGTVTVTE